MQIEKALPSLGDTTGPRAPSHGLVTVHTGPGKGKSTAAFGLALRAAGQGETVKIYQFMKVPTARFGEHRLFEQLGMPIEGLGDGFSWKSRDLEHSAELARAGWAAPSWNGVKLRSPIFIATKLVPQISTIRPAASRSRPLNVVWRIVFSWSLPMVWSF